MDYFISHFIHEFTRPLHNPVLIFSLILIIILLSPLLLRKLNIPSIIGLIISGVIIGPHGLNILAKNSAIELFSTIGLLYIMFIAGLELDMNQFQANRNKSLLFGFFTFIVPISIGFPVCYYLLQYEMSASFLVASMFATHTLVAYPIVSRLGVSKNQAVAVAVGGTILTDTAVLIILAVVIGSHDGGLTGEFWIRLGVSLAIFSAVMFLVIPRLARWFFEKLESEKHSHYIFVLAVVFFAAFLAEVAGVEPIIGAFVAGLALNRLIPHSSALMNRIEFIGNALFIPFFLISVGMIVDVGVLLKGPNALIVAATLSVVALVGKWLAALFTQLVFKFTAVQRQLIFGLSSAHAAATLAVILVGYKAGILDETILNGTILLILVTCIAASFVTERAAKKIVISAEQAPAPEHKNGPTPYEKILLPLSDTAEPEKLLDFAILIRDKKYPDPVLLLAVVPNDESAETNLIRARNRLERFERQAAGSEAQVRFIPAIDHNIASGIVRASRELMASIIVLDWPRRSGVLDKLIGEKVEHVLTNTDKTVFLCHFTQPIGLHKRMVIAAPPAAEREQGFQLWLTKMSRLAQEMSASVVIHCNEITQREIQSTVRRLHLGLNVQFRPFQDWEDILVLTRDMQEEDLVVLISARRGSVSHISLLDSIPPKFEKYLEFNSRILIYPPLNHADRIIEGYDEVSSGTLQMGIDAVQKVSKGIGSMFRKKTESEEPADTSDMS
ncbi:MAG: cation:proton antiporter [Bacteroidia bacterium]|nr:cation:proton antiporter [Bacteroidia bacterium]